MFFQVPTPPDTPLSTNVLLLRSLPSTFRSDFVFTSSLSGFQSSYGCCHFCRREVFLFPKINHIACVSGCCHYWVQKSSKYSLIYERISFSSRRIFPVEFLVEVVVLKLFPRNRRMVCQNTLFADEKLESNRRQSSSQERSLDTFTS